MAPFQPNTSQRCTRVLHRHSEKYRKQHCHQRAREKTLSKENENTSSGKIPPDDKGKLKYSFLKKKKTEGRDTEYTVSKRLKKKAARVQIKKCKRNVKIYRSKSHNINRKNE